MWYDFAIDNPANKNVAGVRRTTIKELFPHGKVMSRKVTLAPPISRMVCKVHPTMYTLFNSLPWLLVHIWFVGLRTNLIFIFHPIHYDSWICISAVRQEVYRYYRSVGWARNAISCDSHFSCVASSNSRVTSILLSISYGQTLCSFRLIKLRTMELATAEVEAKFSLSACDRRTPIGRVLRSRKLDELPQLWNVLKGEMTIVGPRPEVPEWVDKSSSAWEKILSVRPGLADSASIKFIDEDDQLRASCNPYELYKNDILPEKIRLSCDYVSNVSFCSDIKILVMTALRLINR